MRLSERGFSLLETLIAMSLSTLLLLGAMRLMPALQLSVLHQSEQARLQEDLWQLAFTIGKHLQRAGYCRGSCTGAPLTLSKNGECVLVQWDANGNGKWDTATEPEQTGYRIREGSLETQRGATNCNGKGWEKVTDSTLVRLEHFSIQQRQRRMEAPLMIIRIEARPLRTGSMAVSVEHSVVGYNL